MEKPAVTDYAIHELLKNRWSPRAFSRQPVEPEKLLSLFEAARWSPSGGNAQPWSFIVGLHGDSTHDKLVETLTGRNAAWAVNAPVLALSVAKAQYKPGVMNRWAAYDVGQAVAHLTVQASVFGLSVHQMGGFNADAARHLFDIPADYEPMTMIAIGYQGSIDDLPEDLRQRELETRSRRPLRDFIFGEHWNQALELVELPVSSNPSSLL